MKNVYNGIYISGSNYDGQAITSIGNDILMNIDARPAAIATPYHQAGIGHYQTTSGFIRDNNITGPGYASPAPPSATAKAYNSGTQLLEGINNSMVLATQNECNTVTDVNTGFYFGSTCAVHWFNNIMAKNSYGMVLDGNIGIQPNPPTSATIGTVAGNQWATTGFAWAGTNYQTYTAGTATSVGSEMYVDASASAEVPSVNYGDNPLSPPNYYTATILPSSIYTHQTCYSPSATTVSRTTTATGTNIKDRLATIARQQAFVPADPHFAEKSWIAQKLAYELISTDTTVMDTSALLHRFYHEAATSRFRLLAQLDRDVAGGQLLAADSLLAWGTDSMANGNTDTATGLAMADGAGVPTGNVVVNYKQYYQLLSSYMRGTLSVADSAALSALAYKCPFIDGPIVYQARALYTVVFDDMPIFTDANCEAGAELSSPKAPHQAAMPGRQAYSLYPNPTGGNITLQQRIEDNAPASVSIWDATGRVTYSGKMQFAGAQGQLQLAGAAPGLYLLQVIDGAGNRFVIKFTVK
jgi:hypothetical protein